MIHKVLVANWKANPRTHAEAERLNAITTEAAKKYKSVGIVLCMPFPWLTDISHKAKGPVRYGAQNMFWENGGPYTGEVSPGMLKSSKVEYAIIGHSERRRLLGETDEMVNKKILAALRAGITPIICVGETLAVHKKGAKAAEQFSKAQLVHALKGIPASLVRKYGLCVTHEPSWAISTSTGTSKDNADTPENAVRMIRILRKMVVARFGTKRITMLYGGSVNSKNVREFLRYPEIEGVLVGGASIRPIEFVNMMKIASDL